jgi:hypothetical protein
MNRKLNQEEYIFPSFKKVSGNMDTSNHISHDFFKKILLTVGSGEENGYTLHCFRRGGSQHRFVYAAEKWSIRSCQWWGGWSDGDKSDTLMKVLCMI